MSRKTAVCVALLASLHFIAGCAAERVYGPGGKVAPLPSVTLEAKALPEVFLQTKDEAGGRNGKITGLENRTVRFLPSPYWNVETLRIDIAAISRIDVPGKKHSLGRTWLSSFGWGFLVSGGVLAVASQYDEDYQWSLILAPASGAAVGLIAMAATAISGSNRETSYDLTSMSDEERAFVVLKLMGIQR